MKAFLQRVWQCMLLPKKQIVFQLNRERIGVPFLYVGLLLALVCIPLFIELYMNSEGVVADLALPMFAVYFLFIYFPIFALSIYGIMAAVAAIVFTCAKLADRKLTYLMLYKLTAFASTIPIIGYGLSLLVDEKLARLWMWVSVFYLLVILIRVIFYFPKKKR